MSLRDEKATSLLVHLAADFIARNAGRETLITPTRALIGRDRNATVFVSVFPEDHTSHALEFLMRNADDFRAYIKKAARFSHLPRVKFEADIGEQNRRHLDGLSKEIELG